MRRSRRDRRLVHLPIFTHAGPRCSFGLLSFGGETTLAVRLVPSLPQELEHVLSPSCKSERDEDNNIENIVLRQVVTATKTSRRIPSLSASWRSMLA